MRRLLNLIVACLCLIGSSVVLGQDAHAAEPACTGTVQVKSLAFDPATISAGDDAVAKLVAQNCTDQPIQVMVEYIARFTDADHLDSGIVPGCLVYDPYPLYLSLPAGGTATSTPHWSTYPGCPATGMRVTARVHASGGVISAGPADLVIRPATTPAAKCSVAYRNVSEWSSGFVAQVTLTNRGTVAVNGWSLAFSYLGDQSITSSWGVSVLQNGTAVTASSLSWDAVISAGGSVTIGLIGSWSHSSPPPGSFRLNGAICENG